MNRLIEKLKKESREVWYSKNNEGDLDMSINSLVIHIAKAVAKEYYAMAFEYGLCSNAQKKWDELHNKIISQNESLDE